MRLAETDLPLLGQASLAGGRQASRQSTGHTQHPCLAMLYATVPEYVSGGAEDRLQTRSCAPALDLTLGCYYSLGRGGGSCKGVCDHTPAT